MLHIILDMKSLERERLATQILSFKSRDMNLMPSTHPSTLPISHQQKGCYSGARLWGPHNKEFFLALRSIFAWSQSVYKLVLGQPTCKANFLWTKREPYKRAPLYSLFKEAYHIGLGNALLSLPLTSHSVNSTGGPVWIDTTFRWLRSGSAVSTLYCPFAISLAEFGRQRREEQTQSMSTKRYVKPQCVVTCDHHVSSPCTTLTTCNECMYVWNCHSPFSQSVSGALGLRSHDGVALAFGQELK